LAQFKNRDGSIKKLLIEAVQEISKGRGKCDEEGILDILDELDLHAFSEFQL
jgi:hypothetical protein